MRKCGMPVTPDHAPNDPSGATSLDQSTESHLATLHRAAIGPINADYYLPILSRFEAYGRASPSWNWAACVTTLNWMVFRGMWMPALLYGVVVAGAALGVLSVIALAAPMTASLQWSLWAALVTLALLIPGFFGNAWLYGVYRRRLEQALRATPSLKDASMLLARQSSSRPRLVAIAVANLLLAGLIVAWVWPSDLQMRIWPRVSGHVEDLAPPPSVAASASTPAAIAVAPPASAPASAAASAAPAPVLSVAPAAVASAPQPRSEPQTRATPPVVASGKVSSPAGRYLINVGLFAQHDNAQRAHARLAQAGLPALSDTLQTRNGERTRVRVGPFTTQAQADAAAERVRALQLDAIVVRR